MPISLRIIAASFHSNPSRFCTTLLFKYLTPASILSDKSTAAEQPPAYSMSYFAFRSHKNQPEYMGHII